MTGTELIWRLGCMALTKRAEEKMDLTDKDLERFERYDFAVLAVTWKDGKPKAVKVIHDCLEGMPEGASMFSLENAVSDVVAEPRRIAPGNVVEMPPSSVPRRGVDVPPDRMLEVISDDTPF